MQLFVHLVDNSDYRIWTFLACRLSLKLLQHSLSVVDGHSMLVDSFHLTFLILLECLIACDYLSA